jgi:hypothetical protein
MPIVEDEADGIVANSFHLADAHVALAPDQLLLARAMPLHFSAGAFDTQQFCRGRSAFAGVKCDCQTAPFIPDTDIRGQMLLTVDVPGFFRQHDRNAITDWIGKAGCAGHKFLPLLHHM